MNVERFTIWFQVFGFQRFRCCVLLLRSLQISDWKIQFRFLIFNIEFDYHSWHDLTLFDVHYFKITFSVPRLGEFLRQHFSTSFSEPPGKTFCWTVSGMFSPRKDKWRCWKMSLEPTIDARDEWCTFIAMWKYYDENISCPRSLLQRQMDFLEMFWRIRCEFVIGTIKLENDTKTLQITTNRYLDFIHFT